VGIVHPVVHLERRGTPLWYTLGDYIGVGTPPGRGENPGFNENNGNNRAERCERPVYSLGFWTFLINLRLMGYSCRNMQKEPLSHLPGININPGPGAGETPLFAQKHPFEQGCTGEIPVINDGFRRPCVGVWPELTLMMFPVSSIKRSGNKRKWP